MRAGSATRASSVRAARRPASKPALSMLVPDRPQPGQVGVVIADEREPARYVDVHLRGRRLRAEAGHVVYGEDRGRRLIAVEQAHGGAAASSPSPFPRTVRSWTSLRKPGSGSCRPARRAPLPRSVQIGFRQVPPGRTGLAGQDPTHQVAGLRARSRILRRCRQPPANAIAYGVSAAVGIGSPAAWSAWRMAGNGWPSVSSPPWPRSRLVKVERSSSRSSSTRRRSWAVGGSRSSSAARNQAWRTSSLMNAPLTPF